MKHGLEALGKTLADPDPGDFRLEIQLEVAALIGLLLGFRVWGEWSRRVGGFRVESFGV